HQKNASESVAVKDARASDDQAMLKNIVTPNSPMNLGGNMSGDTVVNSQDDEGMKTVTEEIKDGASPGKQTGTRDNAVDVDIVSSVERNLEETPEPCIARRTRNRSGKVVAAVGKKTKSPKKGKKTPASGALKHVLYGPTKTWSKGIPLVESKKKNLKRK
ncbi:hypothetical protein A2U01_0051489, partial [Trifolium medium]|nr:hypothetical protein [Trifolium medium]